MQGHHVFRTAVLSIVLTLAVGQNAALLCGTWCNRHAATATACHHQDPVTFRKVAAGDNCWHQVLNTPAVLQENVRRDASLPDADYAIPVPSYRLAHSTTDARPGQEPGREWSLDTRPLSTALRI